MTIVTDLEVAAISKALGDPNRLSIYTQIAGMQQICCMEMDAMKVISGPTLSHHLKVLTGLGLITARKYGLNVYYRAVPDRFDSYLRYLSGIPKRR